MKTIKRVFCAALALLLLALSVPGLSEAAPPGELEVYFMDLGRVDAILIRCGGEVCFIDVGFHSDAEQAIRWLRAMGIEHLNSYVGTHGHYDHIEGAPDMIEAFHPDTVYLSHIGTLSAMLECATEAQAAVLSGANRVILTPGDRFKVGTAVMTCVGPMDIVRCYTGDSDENDNSLLLRLDYGKRSFLFTSDTTDAVLRRIDKRLPGILEADVMKNPHHNGSHDADVIDLIAPRYVVFCTDDSNPPRESYLDLLAEKGIRTLCLGPANQGSVGIITDGQTMELRCGAAVNAVTLKPAPDLYPGQTLSLSAAVDPADALVPDRQLGWNSSDEAVATVDRGVVRGVAPGTAVITAAALNGVRAAIEVRVMEAAPVLEETQVTLAMGETRPLTASVMPKDARGEAIEWISEDEGVVRVSEGRLTGVGEGRTRVVARIASGAQTFCEVTVKGQLATRVTLDQTRASMKVGDTLTLHATVDPDWYDAENLDWHSSDDSVLWVDGYGNITAVGRGKAKITATASRGVSDSCTIRVNE